jgi:hypothetical protein
MMKIKKINLKKKLETTRINISNSQLRLKNYNNIIKLKWKQVIKLSLLTNKDEIKIIFKK